MNDELRALVARLRRGMAARDDFSVIARSDLMKLLEAAGSWASLGQPYRIECGDVTTHVKGADGDTIRVTLTPIYAAFMREGSFAGDPGVTTFIIQTGHGGARFERREQEGAP